MTPMESLKLSYRPRLERAEIEDDLPALMATGPLADVDLERRIARLAGSYCLYRSYYPHGLWAPGLAVTPEMRKLSEIYLPMEEIRRAFGRFLTIALRFSPMRSASLVHNSVNWLDVLSALETFVETPDPASLLMRLLHDGEARRFFIFANFMPARHGGGFGRYPGQMESLRCWLGERLGRFTPCVRALDAACGSGEGTYELVQLLIGCGFDPDAIRVCGATLEPFELFGAAHCYFPHAPGKTEKCRRYALELRRCGALEKTTFVLDDLTRRHSAAGSGYDVILCNGLLGGPFLHDPLRVEGVVQRLSGQLRPGGILMAASRFHGGWKKEMDDEALRKIFGVCGLQVVEVSEGVAGEKLP